MAKTPSWMVVADKSDTTVGFVEADSPEAAVVQWFGNTYDDEYPVYVVNAALIRTFWPEIPHRTRWIERDDSVG